MLQPAPADMVDPARAAFFPPPDCAKDLQMLALTRKPKQSIDILGIGRITLVAVQGNRVKLTFDFPKHIRVMRTEIVSEFHDSPDEKTQPIEQSAA
jgi:carbon storage regulator CsrA